MKEVWRAISGYEGIYEVSNLGHVKNASRNRIMKLYENGNYMSIRLCKGGKQKNYLVQSLVAKAFLENPNNLHRVEHIDGDTKNNSSDNLRWTGIICGVGVSDKPKSKSTNIARGIWAGMINRCYGGRGGKHDYYKDCDVCEEWLNFSNFEKWFNENKDGYHKGYHLDKDILVKRNRIYGPDTCCFVPQEINKCFIKRENSRGELPIGVFFDSERGKFIGVSVKSNCNKRFDSIEEAFMFYKNEKENYIKFLANKYYEKKLITQNVYDTLMNYKVEITD